MGFGAAFTDASCFTLSRLSDDDRANLLQTIFGKDQHALSIGRIPIGASDYSTGAYSYDDGAADPELRRFSIDHDHDYILPTLRAALNANPDLDHIIPINERHLKRLLSEYIRYYHEDRTHLGLGKGIPNGRSHAMAATQVLSHKRLGGLHHRYDWAA